MTVNLKKKRPEGICAAMRCKEPSAETAADGVELCTKHAPMYEPGEPAPTPGAGPDQATIQAQVDPAKAFAEDLVTKLDLVTITNQSMLDLAGQLLVDVKTRFKELEAQRKSATQPLLDAKRTVDSWFKPATSALQACENKIKAITATYIQGQEDTKVAALQAGDHDAAMTVPAVAMPDGMTTRTKFVWAVTDPALVPREYLTVDAAKVQAVVNDQKGATAIPGIEVKPDVTVVVST